MIKGYFKCLEGNYYIRYNIYLEDLKKYKTTTNVRISGN